MTINDKENILEETKAFLIDDYTELWCIVSFIRNSNPNFSFLELITATRTILAELMIDQKIRLVDENTKKPSDVTGTQLLDTVERHLIRLNRIPDIGDGVWLTIESNYA